MVELTAILIAEQPESYVGDRLLAYQKGRERGDVACSWTTPRRDAIVSILYQRDWRNVRGTPGTSGVVDLDLLMGAGV